MISIDGRGVLRVRPPGFGRSRQRVRQHRQAGGQPSAASAGAAIGADGHAEAGAEGGHVVEVADQEEGRGCLASAAQALSAISPPMPAGSPRVSATGGAHRSTMMASPSSSWR